ncbi:ATP synthase subunit d [Hibiscus syriacus]|uniref:ATP synthase subunit d n=1 Tax=Hibiscus syriacus TaxID=106335 RepID=A0A6A3B729_HIBSY|nr:ATP synthase subunit d [Hibiscus syriacus]
MAVFGSDVNDGQCCVGSEERKKAPTVKLPVKAFIGMFSPLNEKNNEKVEVVRKGLKEKDVDRDEGSCMNCFQFAITWSALVNSFVHTILNSFYFGRKRNRRMGDKDKGFRHSCIHDMKSKAPVECRHSEARAQFGAKNEVDSNLQKFDQLLQESKHMHHDCPQTPSPQPVFDYFKSVTSIWEGQKIDVNGFLGNLKFARVGGVPSGMVGVASQVNKEGADGVSTGSRVETAGSSRQKLASGILSIPLSNVERLKSTFSTVSLTELIELLPLLGSSSQDHPDKKKLFSVQDFFRYTESEGRRFFEELDRDGDGQVTLDDLEVAMRKRNCHRDMHGNSCVALEVIIFKIIQLDFVFDGTEGANYSSSIHFSLFKQVRDPPKSEILASLKNAGLPENEDNAVAMMWFLNADTEESISYGHFRNFMLLLPSDRLLQDDPRNIWFEAATVVAVAPPVEIHTGSVLKSALAGGLANRTTSQTGTGAMETIAVGVLSGGLVAVVTTPFDVMKTRMMTAPGGRPISMSVVAFSILHHEGPLGLFKGAVPRFFWIAPLGAMNFAGYELARKAMVKNEEAATDQLSQKKLVKI